MSRLSAVLSVPVALAACTPGQVTPAGLNAARSTAGDAPSIGADASVDTADHGCQVSIRAAHLVTDDAGEPVTTCDGDACAYTWDVAIDVSTALVAEGATAGLLYRRASADAWREVTADRIGADPNGYTQFSIAIGDHLPGPNDATEAVELIAFARTADGGRLFDHNVNEGDRDNDWLTPDHGMNLIADPYVCTHVVDVATATFGSGWQESVSGDLRVGNALSIQYDLDRLPECRNTHNGYPAWDTTAYVRFEPSGATVSGTVRAFVSDMGHPTNTAVSVPFTTTIPAGTTSAQLWFNNASGAGSSCSTWDSNLGANYRVDVRPAPAEDPCWGAQTWSDPHGGSPTCPSYDVSEQVDAGNCELFVDAFGNGFEGHYGIPLRWLEAWVRVGPQDGQVRGVGLYAAFLDRSDGTRKEQWSFGQEVEPGRWKTGLTWQHSGYMGEGSYLYEIDSFAFFVDVQRSDGHVVRLWQSRGGQNYRWDDAFALPTTAWPIPYGQIAYANPDAGVFDALRTCR